jgi:hypothetical protein
MTDLFQGWFTPGSAADPSTQVNSALRQRIALAMLSAKKGYPKNIGEGLTAIGDAIGDRALMRKLAAADVMDQAEVMGGIPSTTPGTQPQPQRQAAYTPETAEPPARAETPLAAEVQPASASPSGLIAPQPTTRDLRTSPMVQGAGGGATPSRSIPAAPTGAGLGTPMQYEGDGYNPLDQASDLQDQRKPYAQQLNADPAAKLKMAALMGAEEGTGKANSTARQALAETIFNRGVSRGYGNVNQVMDPRYYQPMHERGGAPYAAHVARLQSDPAYRSQVFSEIDRVGGEGTNISNLATDNASGDVARRSMGNQTLAYTAPNQESFFRKDIRPDVHGAGVVPATAAWAQGLATAPPVDATRDGVAQTLLAQNARVMNADDQQAALPPQRQAAPQQAPLQVAQAPAPQTAFPPGYISPIGPEPQPPDRIQPSDREIELSRKVQAMAMRNPYAATGRDAQELARLTQNREYEQARQTELFKSRVETWRGKALEQQKQQYGQAKTIADVEKDRAMAEETRLKNVATVAFGNVPDDIRKDLFASKKVAQSSVQSLNAAKEARAAFEAGTYSGAGADWKLTAVKFLTGMGVIDASEKIANTETRQAAMQPIVASVLHQTSGTSQLSEGELMFARQMAAGKISLDEKTFPRIMAIIEKASTNTIADHQGRINTIVGDNPMAQAIFGVRAPAETAVVGTGPRSFNSETEVEAARLPKGTKVIINGRSATVQ